eukprot:gene6825-9344_t
MTTETKTPKKDAYFKRLNQVVASLNATQAFEIYRDSNNDDDFDDEENEEYTDEQLRSFRYIILTESRNKFFEKATDFVTCGQAENEMMMFDTSTGNNVINGLPQQLKKVSRQNTLPLKFDALLGLTIALHRFDVWIYDNEEWDKGGELEKVVKSLGRAWQKMIKRSNEELGIDTEVTRPGVEALLDDLTNVFHSHEVAFKWN